MTEPMSDERLAWIEKHYWKIGEDREVIIDELLQELTRLREQVKGLYQLCDAANHDCMLARDQLQAANAVCEEAWTVGLWMNDSYTHLGKLLIAYRATQKGGD